MGDTQEGRRFKTPKASFVLSFYRTKVSRMQKYISLCSKNFYLRLFIYTLSVNMYNISMLYRPFPIWHRVTPCDVFSRLYISAVSPLDITELSDCNKLIDPFNVRSVFLSFLFLLFN